MKVRTRFAPSPTGFLHVGGVRTALFAWLVAKHGNGEFLLRIEDTDRSRHIDEAEQHIMDSLQWLGLQWDEPPVRQSQRLEIYKEWAQKLIDSGRAYADSSTEEDLNKLREAAKAAKKPFLFREYRPSEPPKWQDGIPLRFKSEPKDYKWHDEVMGDLDAGPETIDDFILIKSDGYPTYNFAHVIDDYLMQISHVIRSQEFLPSMPKFLNLYDALRIEWPIFATLPYVLGAEGKKKLSKRDGAKDILDYKREGYLPEAMVSFLATLGWNDGTEQEIFTIDELIQKFDLSRVHHSGAKFDEQRLLWVDGHFIRETPSDRLYELAKPFWSKVAKGFGEAHKKDVLALVQERLKYLAELPELTGFFFEEPKQLPDQNLNGDWLKAAIQALEVSDFSEDDLTNRLNELLESLSTSPGELFRMLSMSVSGSYQYPPLPGMLRVLGREESIKRLQNALG